ncbi:putative General secretion pathway protein I, GspI (modular protein) [Candidatus Methylomirabilis oxygeniifera]|uniref:Putative General secretion pathway protein I, GspI (Modular protein) n=1 Tax=Methylomirabilis oxygeniifera TaxID=671143 RepID=D5MJH3_METO1|nr:putative General secretion pathway protein I, GspI (modular protein) [Candidatus Methylomirabilis oxyfera]
MRENRSRCNILRLPIYKWGERGDLRFGARCTLDPALRTPYRSCRTSHGFTLLEVIVALAILGVGFALAVELLVAGVRSAKASEEYTQAVLLARQKIAEVAAARNLASTGEAGEFGGGFRWASEIQPLEQPEELPGRLFSVKVRVTWPGRRGEKAVNLQTLRMIVDEKKLGQTRVVQ